MEISEHFQELRRRLLICIVCFAAIAATAFACFPRLWHFVQIPILQADTVTIVNLSPAEGVSVSILVSCMAAAFATSPLFLYHAYAFCAPAVQKENRRFFFASYLSACALFFSGAFFAYFCAIPLLFQFLLNYSDVKQLWSQTAYGSFLFRFEILFAVLFQMPVACALWGRSGISDRNFLWKHFRIILFLIVLISALVTPPDLPSLFWMAIPMFLLFLLSTFTYRLAWRKK